MVGRVFFNFYLGVVRRAFHMYHFPEAAGDRTRSSLRVVGGSVRIGPSGSEALATTDPQHNQLTILTPTRNPRRMGKERTR